MKKIFSKELVIGICVLLALVILFFGIDYLKGINLFRPANFYTVHYDNVSGLEIAAPVTIDGFKVGQVREINFDYNKPGKIEVVLALNKDLRLPQGTTAIIENTLLSGAVINLHLGKDARIIPKGGEVLPGTAGDLMTTVNEDILPSVTSILPRVDSLMGSLNMLASDPALLSSVRRLDAITLYALAATKGVSGTLNGQLPAIMYNVNSMTRRMDTVGGNLSTFSRSLNDLPLNETMANVNQLTSNLQRFSDQLNNQKSTLGLLMNDPELYNRLNRVTADVDSLILDIKKNPKRYINIKLL